MDNKIKIECMMAMRKVTEDDNISLKDIASIPYTIEGERDGVLRKYLLNALAVFLANEDIENYQKNLPQYAENFNLIDAKENTNCL